MPDTKDILPDLDELDLLNEGPADRGKEAGGRDPAQRSRADDDGDDRRDGETRDDEDTVERRRRRKAQRDAAALRRDNEALTARLEALEQRQTALANVELERQVGSIAGKVATAEEALQKALDEGDARAISAANAQLLAARREEDEAQALVRKAKEPPAPAVGRTTQDRQPAQRPRALENWLDRTPWFDQDMLADPNGDYDPYSEAAAKFSVAIAKRGIASNTDEHFQELDKEMQRWSPHLYEGKSMDRDRNRRDRDIPPTAGGGRRGGDDDRGPGGSTRLDPMEVKVAKAMGIDLSDEKTRKRYDANRVFTHDRLSGA